MFNVFCRSFFIVSLVLPFLVLPCLSMAAGETPVAKKESSTQKGKDLFEGYCSACHTLDLPRSQRLNRANWEWVVDDMVNEMGCNIDDNQQALIINYLVANHGHD